MLSRDVCGTCRTGQDEQGPERSKALDAEIERPEYAPLAQVPVTLNLLLHVLAASPSGEVLGRAQLSEPWEGLGTVFGHSLCALWEASTQEPESPVLEPSPPAVPSERSSGVIFTPEIFETGLDVFKGAMHFLSALNLWCNKITPDIF